MPLPRMLGCARLRDRRTGLSETRQDRRGRPTRGATAGRPGRSPASRLAAGQGARPSPAHGPAPRPAAAVDQRDGRSRPIARRGTAGRRSIASVASRCRDPRGEPACERRRSGRGRCRCGLAGRADGPTSSCRRPAGRVFQVILRKEVIQPQVPLRLPCYDLVPITGFIFGACLCGSGDFGCPPLSWLDGRCVQGSGTHSPRYC